METTNAVIGEKLKFHEPRLEDAARAQELMSAAGIPGCEFSFATLFMWRKYYNNEIAFAHHTMYRRSVSAETIYSVPLGDDLDAGLEAIRELQHDKSEPLQLYVIGEEQKSEVEAVFPGRFRFEESPADFDYIYRTEDLANLSGRKYHGKRNHIAAFDARYNWSYETIDAHNRDEAYDMVRRWCREKGNCSDPGLRSERHAAREVLDNMEVLQVRGGLLRVDGEVAAMTYGSPINPSTFDIQVEKALAAYPGAYTVINREFAARELLGKYEFINRENDLGLDGLRRAKQSYHPVLLLRKYWAEEVL